MAAGSVAAPQIVPLRAPVVGKAKNIIDTDTKIELYTGLLRNMALYHLMSCLL